MKKIIIIIFLFVSLVALGTYELVAVNKIIFKLENITNNLKTNIENNKNNVQTTYPEVINVQNYWISVEDNLSLMFNHKDLSTITDTLSRLSSYVKNNDYDNAIAEVNLLSSYAEKNHDIMGFNLQNLL